MGKFGDERYVNYFDCGDDLGCKHRSKLTKLHALRMCNLLYINYTPITLFKTYVSLSFLINQIMETKV